MSQEQIDALGRIIDEASRIVCFTGAGISTESGIHDFRSPGGIWSRYDPEDFTIQKFLSGPAARRRIWKMSAESGLLTEAEPNPAHYAIAELYQLGKLDCVITQNIDNLLFFIQCTALFKQYFIHFHKQKSGSPS